MAHGVRAAAAKRWDDTRGGEAAGVPASAGTTRGAAQAPRAGSSCRACAGAGDAPQQTRGCARADTRTKRKQPRLSARRRVSAASGHRATRLSSPAAPVARRVASHGARCPLSRPKPPAQPARSLMSPTARVRLAERFGSRRELPVRPPRRARPAASRRADAQRRPGLARACARSLLFAHRASSDGAPANSRCWHAWLRDPAWARLAALSPRGRATLPPSPSHLRAAVCPGASRRGSQFRCAATGGCGVWRREPPRTLLLTLLASRARRKCSTRVVCRARCCAACACRPAPCPRAWWPRCVAAAAPSPTRAALAAPHALATRARCATVARLGASRRRAPRGCSCSQSAADGGATRVRLRWLRRRRAAPTSSCAPASRTMRGSPRGAASPWRRSSRRTGARARPTTLQTPGSPAPCPPRAAQLRAAPQQHHARRAGADARRGGLQVAGRADRRHRARRHPPQGAPVPCCHRLRQRPRPPADAATARAHSR